jgi:hypothetical protein
MSSMAIGRLYICMTHDDCSNGRYSCCNYTVATAAVTMQSLQLLQLCSRYSCHNYAGARSSPELKGFFQVAH